MARWQPWRWSLADVVPHEPAFGTEPRRLRQDEREELWLFPGFAVELFRDDAEGYHLNLASPAPCWFVMWRMDEDTGTNTPLARPVAVSLSYHDAGRWLDAQESVEQVPAAPEVLEGLRAFVDAHYQPEPKRRKRPDGFRTLQDRFGNPASRSHFPERMRLGVFLFAPCGRYPTIIVRSVFAAGISVSAQWQRLRRRQQQRLLYRQYGYLHRRRLHRLMPLRRSAVHWRTCFHSQPTALQTSQLLQLHLILFS